MSRPAVAEDEQGSPCSKANLPSSVDTLEQVEFQAKVGTHAEANLL